MTLPLLLLLLGAPPGAPQSRPARMLSTRTEKVSSVDVSAAQRFGWVDAAARPQPAAQEPPARPQPWVGSRASQLLPTFRAEADPARPWSASRHELARAARWIDALPFKLDAQDGGMMVTLRLRP